MIRSVAIKLSGNKFAQAGLSRLVAFLFQLMGIGTGSSVNSSGEKAVFKELRTSPCCIFDVGANKGQFLNLATRELGNCNYEIHSFEPSKYTFDLLSKNIPKDTRIRLNNCGLGKVAREITLYYDSPGSGLASLSKRRLDHFELSFNEEEIVKIRTLDEYCTENLINHIHLLKIDVEGHELDVLLGGIEMFCKQAIDLVMFEFGGCNIDSRTYFQDYFYFFKEHKMSIYRITPSGYLHHIPRYAESHEQFVTTNFLAKKNF